MARGTCFNYYLDETLKSPKEAAGFIQAAIEDNDPDFFIQALSRVIRVHGMSHLADETGIARQSLYQMTSADGNPTLKNVNKILDQLGLELTVRVKKTS